MKMNRILTGGLLLALTAAALTAATADRAAAGRNQDGLLDEVHSLGGVSCADCHDAGAPRTAVPMIRCLDCHDTGDVAAATADVQPTNPHQSDHYGTEADCNLCHHQHRASENYCTPCHVPYRFEVP